MTDFTDTYVQTLNSGDTLFVTSEHSVPLPVVQRLQKQLDAAVPGIRLVILEQGMRIEGVYK